MDGQTKADLILHPTRLQILQTLAGRSLTTAQINAEMPGTPLSSIYRHLKRLLDGGLVQVVEIAQVRGAEERVFSLSQNPQLTADDVASMDHADHLRVFTTYLATLLGGFASYLDSSETYDFLADRAGYHEIQFFASAEEMDAFRQVLDAELYKLLEQPLSSGRVRRKLAFINHPLQAGLPTQE